MPGGPKEKPKARIERRIPRYPPPVIPRKIYEHLDRFVIGQDRESSLRIGQIISSALVAVVKSLSERSAWVIAKGGITSSDVATQGLRIKRAEVLGQALPGIPIWRTGRESRWPGMTYVVFPGNVGGPDALAEMIRALGVSPDC